MFYSLLVLQNIFIASAILFVHRIYGFTLWWSGDHYVTNPIIGMHFGITMTMNIRFDAFIFQLILVGYPWYRLIDYYLATAPKLVQKWV